MAKDLTLNDLNNIRDLMHLFFQAWNRQSKLADCFDSDGSMTMFDDFKFKLSDMNEKDIQQAFFQSFPRNIKTFLLGPFNLTLTQNDRRQVESKSEWVCCDSEKKVGQCGKHECLLTLKEGKWRILDCKVLFHEVSVPPAEIRELDPVSGSVSVGSAVPVGLAARTRIPIKEVPLNNVVMLPCATFVGSYGGGSSFSNARLMFLTDLPWNLVTTEQADRLDRLIADSLKANLKYRDELVQLPSTCPPLARFQQRLLRFQISSRAYLEFPEQHLLSHNLFFHSLMFDERSVDDYKDPPNHFPLIGVFGCDDGIGVVKALDPANAGQGLLTYADQHLHRVDGDGQAFHYGSDMARFLVVERVPIAKFVAVAVDFAAKIVEMTFFLIVKGETEPVVDKVLNKFKGNDVCQLARELNESLGPTLSQQGRDALTELSNGNFPFPDFSRRN